MHHIAAPYSRVRLAGLFFFVIAIAASPMETSAAVASISGSPPKSAIVGKVYGFTPTLSDVAGATPLFRIQNRPDWTTFNSATGRLTGAPNVADVGTDAGVIISVSTDGKTWASLPAFAIVVTEPTVSGTPAKSVIAGQVYKFKPTATVPAGTTLSFSIVNKPEWATFSASAGTLAGTPAAANVGTYSNIRISASDGITNVTLPAFAVSVTEVGTKAATLSWSAPTENTDGSALSNLAGYRIYYGRSKIELTQSITVRSVGITTYVISNLSSGTYYFAIKAYTTAGAESKLSDVVSRTV
jgi:hypothetical protein